MIGPIRWQVYRAPCVVLVHFLQNHRPNFGCPRRSERLISLAFCCTLARYLGSLRAQHNSSVTMPTKGLHMSINGGRLRSINFQDYDVFGFDLDHTIAKYKLVHLFRVAYECVTTFLVNERGYDPVIKTDLHSYTNFICKGLFLDVEQGNILKLGENGVILKGTHGTRKLTEQELQQQYGNGKKWELADQVLKNMCHGPGNMKFRFFENYFDCPGLVATARIIDLIDERQSSLSVKEKQKLYAKAWKDALDSLQNMYDPRNVLAENGGYFTIVKQHPRKFIEECSADIKKWLKSLRESGKMVFLLTTSAFDYASCLLEVCLGQDWQSYFDISLFNGRKPGFFTASPPNPFKALEGCEEMEIVTQLKRNGCYSQGNVGELCEFFASELGKTKEEVKVVYFGDNICSDCFPTKTVAKWSAVLVLEEMDAEGYLCSDGTVPGHERDAENMTIGPVSKRKFIEHSKLVTEEEIEWLLSDFWGPFLIHGTKNGWKMPLRMNTFWGNVISRYSDIAVPSMEYLAVVPLDHEFETFTGKSGDATGFHPGRPSSLLP